MQTVNSLAAVRPWVIAGDSNLRQILRELAERLHPAASTATVPFQAPHLVYGAGLDNLLMMVWRTQLSPP